jgi:alkylhydroperoxidase family enzyme
MMNGKARVIGVLGLMLFPAVVDAQELRPKASPSDVDGRRPFGFQPDQREHFLTLLLLDQPPMPAQTSERLPMLTNEQAWKRLPGAPAAVQPLPAWARQLAGPLPLTTARMLELDALHRSGKRLEPKLRSLVRWAAADANHCDYAKAIALADLQRAGASPAELRLLTSEPNRLAPQQRAAVDFARKMMRQAYTVTDEEVKQLLGFFGEEQVVALVALLAHASFQDRLFLVLNVHMGPEGPLPPLEVQFAKPQPPKPAAQGSRPAAQTARSISDAKDAGGNSEWSLLRQSVDEQKKRSGRIRVPSKEDVRKRLGDGHPGLWQTDIVWSRVCYGYQPELTQAWFDCVAAFRQEAGLDRIFEQELFWIVTRSLHCFY